MTTERPMIHTRISRSLLKVVDHVAVDRETDRARAVEWLLRFALAELIAQGLISGVTAYRASEVLDEDEA